MAKRKGNSLAYRVTSGAPPSDYLVSGEVVKWQGKPAAIIILGRGLLLTVFGLIYFISMALFFNGDHDNLLAVGVGAIACILMIVERRLGLIGGVAGLAVATWSFLAGSAIEWYWFLIPLAFGLLSLLIDYIYLSRVLFVITDRRIISRYGIFTLRYADTGIDKVQNVTVIQPWYERLLGYGDVFFATAGEKGGIDYQSPGIKLMSGGAVMWENVGRPFEVVKAGSAVIHSGATPVVVVNQPMPSSEVEVTDERLRELDELLQKRMISQDEYERKRKQILDRL